MLQWPHEETNRKVLFSLYKHMRVCLWCEPVHITRHMPVSVFIALVDTYKEAAHRGIKKKATLRPTNIETSPNHIKIPGNKLKSISWFQLGWLSPHSTKFNWVAKRRPEPSTDVKEQISSFCRELQILFFRGGLLEFLVHFISWITTYLSWAVGVCFSSV